MEISENGSNEIWQHYTKLSGSGRKATCNYCEKTIAYFNGFSNLRKHIKLKHNAVSLPPQFIKRHSSDALWEHFTKSWSSENRAKCNHCKRILTFLKGDLHHLRKHLKLKHKTISLPPPTIKQCPGFQSKKSSTRKEKKISSQQEMFSPKRKDKAMKSNREANVIWNHFTKSLEENKMASCNYCEATLNYSTLSNLRRHMKLKHKTVSLPPPMHSSSQSTTANIEEEADFLVIEISSRQECETSSTQEGLTFSSQPPLTYPMVQSTNHFPDFETTHSNSIPRQIVTSQFVEIMKPIPKYESQAVDVQLTKLICKLCNLFHPFNLVEDVEFRKFVKLLCPGYNLPSRKTISQTLIPSLYRTTRDELKVKLTEAKAVCITVDSWISIKNIYFYAITTHHIDQDMKLHSNLINCSEFERDHSTTNISEWLDEVLNKWKIRNKIIAAITENNANIITAINALSIFHLPCFANSLNWVVENAVNDCLRDLVNRVEAIVQYFKRDKIALAKFQQLQRNMNNLRLKQNIPCMWNSTFEMLNGVLKNRKTIISTFEFLQLNNLLALETEDWKILEHAVSLLEVFDEVTKEISSEKNVSLSKTCVLSRGLVRRMRESLQEKKKLPYEIKALGNQLLQGLIQKFGERENSDLISQALLLDPRFKKQGFGDKLTFQLTYSALTMNIGIMSKSSQPIPKSHVKSSSIWEEYDATIEQLNEPTDPTGMAIMELDRYLLEPVIRRTSDPLAWWRERKIIYPNLYEIARQRLCILANFVPCEQIQEEKILNKMDYGLASSTVAQILFLNSNLE